jgi:POT family proton-dependent oligopeptide transporter
MARKHPTALPFLFLTEMWERFGYYLMIGIFQLYLMDPTSTGGLAMERKDAADIYGTFIALVFLTPFIGGLLADRVLGYTKAIYIGGTLMGLGYMGLALPGMTAFYTSLGADHRGQWLLQAEHQHAARQPVQRGSVPSAEGQRLQHLLHGHQRRGLHLQPLRGLHAQQVRLGLCVRHGRRGHVHRLAVFYFGMKHFRHADVKKPAQKEDMPLSKVFGTVLLPAIIVGMGGWAIPGNVFGSDSTDAFIFATIPVIIFYVGLYLRASIEDKKPLVGLLSIFAVSILFWAVFKQNGTALTTWAQYYTDRELPAAIAPAANDFYLAERW